MTTETDLCNRALQAVGTRTTVTAAELANQTSNEAIQFNLCYENCRDSLLRMAPWDCGLTTANLTYITSTPGTPENTSPATPLWTPGQPAPPWAYEYQYPVDCLRACVIIPANQTGFTGGVPITTAVTGGVASWTGPAVRFKVAIDQFYPVTACVVAFGGINYNVGDVVTLAGYAQGAVPIGAPLQVRVLTAPAGVIGTVEIIPTMIDSDPPTGGSYFAKQTSPVAQGSTTGSGSGATFTLTFGTLQSQRVILTNQEFAILQYVKQIIDPNLMDPLFSDALVDIVGATMAFQLTGDKGVANGAIARSNASIIEARKADGNEGLTVNDITPDWIRIRGINYLGGQSGPYAGYDWGSNLWPLY